MKIKKGGQESWMVSELVRQLLNDSQRSGVYCVEAYIGHIVEQLCDGESHAMETMPLPNGLREASWMRCWSEFTVYADYNAEANTLTFSRCPF